MKGDTLIAVDAMGGDFAPDIVLKGALSTARDGAKVCLFGPEKDLINRLLLLDPEWEKYRSQGAPCLVVVDSPEVIEMGDEPVQAVRKKRNSSLVKAVESVAEGRCEAIVSAGNSGAVMAAALFFIGRIKGIDRPALTGLFQAPKGPVICLDLGANADCKAENIFQFAHLGARYAHDMLGIKEPAVGLLSNGEEPGKGPLVVKEAFCMLRDSGLHFYGNVEPSHLFKNKVDVVVCDGFSGNILLKTMEAVASFFVRSIKDCFERAGLGETEAMGLSKLAHNDQGGALLLGVKKPVIISHGSASDSMIKNAIMFAQKIALKVDLKSYEGGGTL